jgi:hypothetical protein
MQKKPSRPCDPSVRNLLRTFKLKAFHQSLIDEKFPPTDTKYIAKRLCPGLITELVRPKGENAKLEAGNERLTSELFQSEEGRRDDSPRRKKSAGHRAVKQHSATTRNVSSGTENHGVPGSNPSSATP